MQVQLGRKNTGKFEKMGGVGAFQPIPFASEVYANAYILTKET